MLTAENLTKTYRRNVDVVKVLNGVSLTVRDGEFLSIVGASGSGKSTLLHLLGTLDAPDSGAVLLDGKRVYNLSNRERDTIRNRTFGYVFQFYHLLPELSAFDNALMPAYISNSLVTVDPSRKRTQPIVELVRAVSELTTWTRLLYLYPSDLTDDLIDTICATGVPYFDLSLQHVSKPLLRRMRRWGDGQRFLERITDIRAREPHAAG